MSTTTQATDPAEQATRGTAAGRIAVVVNGNAKNVTGEVISTLDQILRGGDLFVSRQLEECPDIARTVVNRGYGTVLTGGGDGTFTVVVTEVIKEARRQGRVLPRFGLLKLGTGNSLAWVVGASKAKGRGLAADIQRLRQDAGSRPMRLIEVEDFIAPFCGFGADAVVLRDYHDVRDLLLKTPLRSVAPGPLSYAVSSVTRTLPKFVFGSAPHCRVVNEGGDAFKVGPKGRLGPPIRKGEIIYEGPARIAGISTIPYYGFGFRAFPFAMDRPDRMSLRMTMINSAQLVMNFRALWRGEFVDPATMFDYLVEDVTVEMDPATPFQIGGDVQGARRSVRATLSPSPIQLVDFYAPPSAD